MEKRTLLPRGGSSVTGHVAFRVYDIPPGKTEEEDLGSSLNPPTEAAPLHLRAKSKGASSALNCIQINLRSVSLVVCAS